MPRFLMPYEAKMAVQDWRKSHDKATLELEVPEKIPKAVRRRLSG